MPKRYFRMVWGAMGVALLLAVVGTAIDAQVPKNPGEVVPSLTDTEKVHVLQAQRDYLVAQTQAQKAFEDYTAKGKALGDLYKSFNEKPTAKGYTFNPDTLLFDKNPEPPKEEPKK